VPRGAERAAASEVAVAVAVEEVGSAGVLLMRACARGTSLVARLTRRIKEMQTRRIERKGRPRAFRPPPGRRATARTKKQCCCELGTPPFARRTHTSFFVMDTTPSSSRTTFHAHASTARPQRAGCPPPRPRSAGRRCVCRPGDPFPGRVLVAASASSSSRSFDEDDQLDTEPSRELWRVDPSVARAQAARLDLLWSVGSKVRMTEALGRVRALFCCLVQGAVSAHMRDLRGV
jgi:hypothetical protein